MDSDLMAKRLLASSYVNSALRVRLAMQVSLTVQNSREPTEPPAFPGEVVGLCGQGGRHAYFRIPVNVLDAALTRIERVQVGPYDPDDIERAMEEMQFYGFAPEDMHQHIGAYLRGYEPRRKRSAK